MSWSGGAADAKSAGPRCKFSAVTNSEALSGTHSASVSVSGDPLRINKLGY